MEKLMKIRVSLHLVTRFHWNSPTHNNASILLEGCFISRLNNYLLFLNIQSP